MQHILYQGIFLRTGFHRQKQNNLTNCLITRTKQLFLTLDYFLHAFMSTRYIHCFGEINSKLQSYFCAQLTFNKTLVLVNAIEFHCLPCAFISGVIKARNIQLLNNT